MIVLFTDTQRWRKRDTDWSLSFSSGDLSVKTSDTSHHYFRYSLFWCLINHSISLILFLSPPLLSPSALSLSPPDQIFFRSSQTIEYPHHRQIFFPKCIGPNIDRVFPSMKIKDLFKSSQSGTLSPMTTTTTSSGYSTGSSSISAKALPTLKKSFSASIGLKKASTNAAAAAAATAVAATPTTTTTTRTICVAIKEQSKG